MRSYFHIFLKWRLDKKKNGYLVCFICFIVRKLWMTIRYPAPRPSTAGVPNRQLPWTTSPIMTVHVHCRDNVSSRSQNGDFLSYYKLKV